MFFECGLHSDIISWLVSKIEGEGFERGDLGEVYSSPSLNLNIFFNADRIPPRCPPSL